MARCGCADAATPSVCHPSARPYALRCFPHLAHPLATHPERPAPISPPCSPAPLPPAPTLLQPRRAGWLQVHTVPTKVTGHCGSVSVRLIPAPRGAGIVAGLTPKKVRCAVLCWVAGSGGGLWSAVEGCGERWRAVGAVQGRDPTEGGDPAGATAVLLLPAQVLQMAGIEDCYTASHGNTKTQVQGQGREWQAGQGREWQAGRKGRGAGAPPALDS